MEGSLSDKRKELLKSLMGMKDTPMDMIMINSIIGVIQDQDKEFLKELKKAFEEGEENMPIGDFGVILNYNKIIDKLAGANLI